MADKFIQNVSGGFAEKEARVTSTGAVDSGAIIALDSTGRLDQSVMPTGIGADTITAIASESITAGNIVNLWDDAGTLSVRKADSSNGRRACGFVKESKSTGQSVSVFMEGSITNVTSVVPGQPYFLSEVTAGEITDTAPTTSGYMSQEIGYGTSTSSVSFEPQTPITLA